MVEFWIYLKVELIVFVVELGEKEGILKIFLRFGVKVIKIEIGKSIFWGSGESC